MKIEGVSFCSAASIYLSAALHQIQSRVIIALLCVVISALVMTHFIDHGTVLMIVGGCACVGLWLVLTRLHQLPIWFKSWAAQFKEDPDARALLEAMEQGHCRTYEHALKWIDIRRAKA